jgi:hypothetical protein
MGKRAGVSSMFLQPFERYTNDRISWQTWVLGESEPLLRISMIVLDWVSSAVIVGSDFSLVLGSCLFRPTLSLISPT